LFDVYQLAAEWTKDDRSQEFFIFIDKQCVCMLYFYL